jgi:hypothetical protein
MELRIASPCSADGDRRQGDERVRYCPECKLNVYNFGAMAPAEIESLVRNREGRLCARFYARPDGTFLTQNCPDGFRAKVRRVSRTAGAILSAAMSATFATAPDRATSFSISSIATLGVVSVAEGYRPDRRRHRQSEGLVAR